MAECSQLGFELAGLKDKKIEGNFEGGNVTSDGGLVVLRQVDRNTRRIRLWLSSSFPLQELLCSCLVRFCG